MFRNIQVNENSAASCPSSEALARTDAAAVTASIAAHGVESIDETCVEKVSPF